MERNRRILEGVKGRMCTIYETELLCGLLCRLTFPLSLGAGLFILFIST